MCRRGQGIQAPVRRQGEDLNARGRRFNGSRGGGHWVRRHDSRVRGARQPLCVCVCVCLCVCVFVFVFVRVVRRALCVTGLCGLRGTLALSLVVAAILPSA